MPRWLVLLISLLSCAGPACAGAPGVALQSGPRLLVPQSRIDLGAQVPGRALWFAFRLRNSGSVHVEIREVKPCWGRLSVECAPAIAPGEEIAVRVRVGPSSVEGPLFKIVRLVTSDPQAPVVVLVAQARLQAPIVLGDGPFCARPDAVSPGAGRGCSLSSIGPRGGSQAGAAQMRANGPSGVIVARGKPAHRASNGSSGKGDYQDGARDPQLL
jgi:hypothetical protein